MNNKFQVQVFGEFGGLIGGWRPALDGSTCEVGVAGCEFDSHAEAAHFLDAVLLPQLTSNSDDGDPRYNAPKFRIVQVQATAGCP